MTYKRVLYVLSFLFWIKLNIVRIYLGNPVDYGEAVKNGPDLFISTKELLIRGKRKMSRQGSV